ncbi:pH regulation protein F [Actinotalea ferrariae]|uniref:monovalent cation/H+ antiporter complex subunit F n=1 Tax=Actinotalea ferrariae TaxID=1386098 RepID=UPI001C8B4BD5|nr:monovalent cation/H+ antiporter complex subunit F [Actinotalea ferrariae]MBX9246529.1 pH regulation protein F [Actinotalea ferrariae]
MNVVILLAGALLGATAILALVRAEKGPSVLDRALALDILTGALVGAIALEAAWSRRIDTVPILVAVALVGFVASVTVARFVAVEAEGEGRILTRDELAALENERIEADAAQRASTDEEHHGGLAQGEVS